MLNQLTRDLKARDYIIKELSDRLSKTADAAESVVSAVHAIDKESQIALSEVDHLHSELRRAAQEVCLLVHFCHLPEVCWYYDDAFSCVLVLIVLWAGNYQAKQLIYL